MRPAAAVGRALGRAGGLGAPVLLVLLGAPSPAAADSGPWAWPLAGPREVSRPFAPPAVRYAAGHRGADLPSTPGAAVRAAGAGRVSYAGLLAGRGVVVVVHGTLRTTYEPVTATVSVGDEVATGEGLGVLEPGHGGCPYDACLHWGLRRGDTYLDPVRLVQAGPVRLLPVGAGPFGTRVGQVAAGAEDAGGAAGAGPRRPAPLLATEPVAARDRSPLDRVPLDRAPLGLVALASLVAGIGLLARPRTGPPDRPTPAAARSVSPDPAPDDVLARSATVHELDVERLRRRTG